MTTAKYVKDSRTIKTNLVLPNDTNNHKSLFGGILLKHMDEISSIAARRHCRTEVVTASTDSVDFLSPIYQTDSFCLEAFVTYVGRTSMEVFIKVIAEDLDTGERRMAANSFFTFVAIGSEKKPVPVPQIIPESEEEKILHESGKQRAEARKIRKAHNKELTTAISTLKPWE